MRPTLAVVFCTLDRADPLQDALRDVLADADDAVEVLVIDQTADPAPVEQLVGELGDRRVRLIRSTPGLPAARNLGLRETSASIVLFLDDDVRLTAGCLRAHVRAYGDPRVGGVVGRIHERVLRPNSAHTTNRVSRSGRVRTRLDGASRQRIDTLKGCNMSFRRLAIEQAGGFQGVYGGTAFLEDADASTRVTRLGWHLWFEPEAEVQHLSSPRGGVRPADPIEGEWWRFHNTGAFVRTHRGMLDAPWMLAVFSAIAARRAFEWRRPSAVPRLMGALATGWSRAADGADKS